MKLELSASESHPISTLSVFPTLLHTRDDFIQSAESADLQSRAEDKADLDDDELKTAIVRFGIDALRASKVDLSQYDALELTEAWFNVLQPGDHHWDHTHANHTLSGIIYLTEGSYTIFGDPRPAATVLSLSYKDAAPGNARTYIHRGAANGIIVFPSWLPHRVATTAKLRKSISFNLFLRGKYGGSRSREEIRL